MDSSYRTIRDCILDSGLGQQSCKVCGRPDKFDFHVPDETWDAIVPHEYHAGVVCLSCFDEFAVGKGIDYSNAIKTLYFAGRKVTFRFEVAGGGKC